MEELLDLMKTRQEQRAGSIPSSDDLFFQSYAQEIKRFDYSMRHTIKQKIANIFMDAENYVSQNRLEPRQRIPEIQGKEFNNYYSASIPSNPAALPEPSLTTLQNINFAQALERDISFQNI